MGHRWSWGAVGTKRSIPCRRTLYGAKDGRVDGNWCRHLIRRYQQGAAAIAVVMVVAVNMIASRILTLRQCVLGRRCGVVWMVLMIQCDFGPQAVVVCDAHAWRVLELIERTGKKRG